MPTSDANEPLRTSADSPDTLPVRGYTMDQLKNYILRQLGFPTWNVEVTAQQILDCIQDGISLFSEYVPLQRPQSIQLQRGKYRYLEDADVGYGVASVSFVESVPAPTEIFYGNLISPAPIMRTGLDEYDTFMRWRKTWMRVTSIQPDWYYDDYEKVLYIHNPLERYHCGVICYFPYPNTQSLTPVGSRWVKEYATARARYIQGDIWSKFSGAIPGPVKDIQLDSSRRESAKAEIDALKEQLKGMMIVAPITVD